MDLFDTLRLYSSYMYVVLIIYFIYIIYKQSREVDKTLNRQKNIKRDMIDKRKYNDLGPFYFNVLKKNTLYLKQFAELGEFNNFEEKDKFICAFLILLVMVNPDDLHSLQEEYKGKIGQGYVNEFIQFWKLYSHNFTDANEYKYFIK